MAIINDDIISSSLLTISVAGSILPPILIDTISSVIFEEGITASHDLSQYVTLPSGYAASSYAVSGTLPSGVTFNTTTGVLSYDGAGSAATISGIVLTVNASLINTPIIDLTLNSSAIGSMVPWTLGHGFAEGDIPSGFDIFADVPQFQSVIRNRWPDGSAKYAVLSGRCDFNSTSRTVQLSAGPVVSTSNITLSNLISIAPDISVQVGSFGTVTLASVINSPYRQLLAGATASEWQYRLPVDSQLCVWMYVRLYAGGAIEYLVSVENGYYDFTGATNKVARIIVTESGSTVKYDSLSAIDIRSHTRIVCTTGYSGKLWYGTTPAQVTPSHNTAYLQGSGLVPSFQAQTISNSTLNTLAQAYTPYGIANLPGNGLGGGGDHPSIGWLPRWDACYTVSGDSRAYKSALVNSFASAGYSYHYRNSTHFDVMRYSDAPTSSVGLSANNGVTGGRAFYSGQYGTDWDISHGWLPGAFAYLISGDYWHLEELQFAVKWVHYTSNVSYRGQATGLMVRNLQQRGVAWALRNCSMAATFTPDGDSERAAYANAVGASLSWLRDYHTNTLGLVLEPDQVSWGDPGGQRTWMSDYVVGTVSWILDLKLITDSTQVTKSNAFMTWLGDGLVQRMSGGSNANGWHFAYQTYSPVISDSSFPGNQNQANFDANWGEAFERKFGRANGTDLDTGYIKLEPGSNGHIIANWTNLNDFNAGYFPYAMSALAQCVNRGITGADTAFARITSATNYNTCRASLINDPRWGIGVRN
jgi:hypothetical protein